MSAAPNRRATAAASGSLRRELGATLALGWPIVLANVGDLRDDRDRLRHARPAVAGRARRWRAWLQSLPARDGARHRRRCGARADHGGEDRRGRERRGASRAPRIRRCCRLSRSRSSPGSTSGGPSRILLAIGEPADLARDAGAYMRGYQWSLLAEPSVRHRALRLLRARAAAPDPGRRPRRGGFQCAGQLCPRVRRAWDAARSGSSAPALRPRCRRP